MPKNKLQTFTRVNEFVKKNKIIFKLYTVQAIQLAKPKRCKDPCARVMKEILSGK